MFSGYYDYDDDYGRSYASEARRTSQYSSSLAAARPAQRATQQELDFTQHMLAFNPRSAQEVSTDLQTLPARSGSRTSYYSRFLPFILEDARATIASGLDKSRRHIYPPFRLTLTANVLAPKNAGNPWTLNFHGSIQTPDDNSPNMNVLILRLKQDNGQEKSVLALASENKDAKTVKAKVIISEGWAAYFSEQFKRGKSVQATYLGSVVTHQRMYEACTKATKPSCLLSIATGQLTLPAELPRTIFTQTTNNSQNTSNLNHSQRSAAEKFKQMSSGTLLLQGPPGTGKTTTLTSVLADAAATSTRTLVCAPSNKAVQVLADRFYATKPEEKMILVGVQDKIPQGLKPISLHSWVDNLLGILKDATNESRTLLTATAPKKKNEKRKPNDVITSLSQISRLLVVSVHNEKLNRYAIVGNTETIRKIHDLIKTLKTLLTNQIQLVDTGKFLDEYPTILPEISSALTHLIQYIESIKNKLSASREEIESKLLNNATIIFSTLSVSGRQAILEMNDVNTLIVDEAGQSVEAETLIAFQHNPQKVLLVGDTKQLPATVISQAAKDKHYDWSMMWRLAEECRQPSLMITEQYRMHPEICQWPSQKYYQGRLTTAASLTFNCSADGLNRPYAFYAMSAQQNKEGKVGNSTFNQKEVDYVSDIVKKLRETDNTSTIGVITFYMAQKDKISDSLKQKHLINNVKVSTVDGFQGDECDIVIISFVRSNRSNTVGFVDDFRRLNVAITRAKSTLIMLGDKETLQAGSTEIQALITDAQQRGRLFTEQQLKTHIQPPVAETQSAAHASSGTSHSLSKKPKPKKVAATAFAASSSSATQPLQAAKQDDTKGKLTGKNCRFFNGKPNSCRKGSECKFQHSA